MNARNAKDYLPLVQAMADGKVIEMYWSNGWKELEETSFSGPAERYRIKPEPREIWVNHYYNPCRLDQICDSQQEANQRAVLGQLFCQKRYREVIE